MIKKLLSREKEISRKEYLMKEMKEALTDYRNALLHYDKVHAEIIDNASPSMQLIAQELEVYRHRYFEARMQYEKEFGDTTLYEEKLHYFFVWREGVNLICKTQQPYDQHTTKLALEKAI